MVANTEKYSFYDLRAKKKFVPKEYVVKIRGGRRFAVAISPSGTESWRVLGMTK